MLHTAGGGVRCQRALARKQAAFFATRLLALVCLGSALAAPASRGAGHHPPMVDMAVDMKFRIVDPQWFDGTKLNIHYRQPPQRVNPETLTQQDDANWVRIFPPDGEQFDAVIKRVARNGHLPELVPPYAARLCLRWADNGPPANTPNRAAYHCEEGDPPGQCSPTTDDPGWFAGCAPAGRSGWNLIGSAHAQPAALKSWVVPSVQTLERLSQTYLVGYTRFDVTAVSPPAKADHAVVRVFVNDAELLVDGVSSDYHPLPVEARKNLKISFGVQTLNMDGRVAGCNRIEIVVQYFQGPHLLLTHRAAQNYAALRALAGATVAINDTQYEWKGTYVRPTEQPETMVLFASYFDLAAAQKAKAKFDAAGATYHGRRLRAVIRPPLSEPPAYGLGAAVVEESGQLRFVFEKEDARQVLAELVAGRASFGLEDIIGRDALMSTYPRPNDRGNPGVCPVAS